jgi:RNA recognition motif-containing protein
MPLSIYVGNLNLATSGRDLEAAFASYGTVTSARIAADSSTGRPRGFGFVEMTDRLEAEAAITGLNGTHLLGNRLTVNESEPLDERRASGNWRGPRRGTEPARRRW